jgi:DNA uptake protein ComE-like DNA-binding protein
MKRYYTSIALTAAALLISVNQSLAVENNTDATRYVGSSVMANPKVVKSNIDTRQPAAANIKPVDINRATRKQLKSLPGIGNAEADKIIAGRPYGSKANLVTRNIISIGVYETIKKRIIAKQFYKEK